MLVEVDTDLQGLTILLAAIVEINRHDCRRDPRLREDLERRILLPPRVGLEYRRDPAYLPDRWSTWAVLSKRTAPHQPMKDDCEGQASIYATARLEIEKKPIAVLIRQPDATAYQPSPMAHAYNEIPEGGKIEVFDGSVLNGMHAPPPEFYASGRVGRILLEP